jgi:hypothetical protein
MLPYIHALPSLRHLRLTEDPDDDEVDLTLDFLLRLPPAITHLDLSDGHSSANWILDYVFQAPAALKVLYYDEGWEEGWTTKKRAEVAKACRERGIRPVWWDIYCIL